MNRNCNFSGCMLFLVKFYKLFFLVKSIGIYVDISNAGSLFILYWIDT